MHNKSVINLVKDNYLLVLIVLTGIVLRVYNLGAESIWYDESISLAVSKLSITDQLTWNIVQNESNPPFYYMVLHFWIPLFGDSEFISRMPSAIFGSLSIPAIYAVGKLMFNKKAGLLAALILAVSVFHIRYSQEARGYTLMVLLTLVSFYSLLRMTGSRKRVYGVLYVLCNVLLMYTHYYGALVVVSQNIFYFTLFLRDRKAGEIDIRRWLTLQAVTGLLFLPGFLLWAKVTLSIQSGFWVPEPTLGSVAGYFTEYAGSGLVLIIFVIFALLSVASFRNIKDSRRLKNFIQGFDGFPESLGISSGSVMYLLILWLLVPILVPFIISIASTPVLVFRYTICASLAFYLLVAKGISNLANNRLVLAVSAVIVVLSLINVDKLYERIDRPQWREVIKGIETDAGYGDVVLIFPSYEKDSAEYYRHRDDLKVITMSERLPTLPELGNRNIWIVIPADSEDTRSLKLESSTGYDLLSERSYVGLNVLQLSEKNLYNER